ncbi:MAG: CPBP family intramembrane metalloprotease [Polyangiaceae bacterium]|jgi:membrane protease YdiL (CAAX protease family)|nr:CPBP family intramembrane metalloprotease [Polyangiaceae bacterium]MBK8941612.1 CPBP family intramembrane metalloprotease [Polyangiaceae bacterium]
MFGAALAHVYATLGAGALGPASAPAPAPLPAPAPAAPELWETLLRLAFPMVGFVLVIPLVYYFFRRTWRELDVEALEHQRETLRRGELDRRPLVLFVLTAAILTLQFYYDRDFYVAHVRPYLREVELNPDLMPLGLGKYVSMKRYGELYALSWWTFTRVAGYTLLPFAVWKLVFPKDSLLDLGLRARGLLSHAWIYLLCLGVVIPAVFAVASQPDFTNYYPFYKKCSRSWLDLLVWESMYVLQFLGLEIFFRGFWLNTLRRSMGSTAIFAMCVPYCMIHYGKPYLEACGAVVAGIALGSLSMRTKSIYSGFFVHVTVAVLMDTLAISAAGGLPTELYPPADPPPAVRVPLVP